MYQVAAAARPRSWPEVEADFVRAMEAFDANVASGLADDGDLQNGKGDFLNDVIALLLEECAGVDLFTRRGVPGLVFPKHNLDITYPNSGVVEFTLEVKAVGTPKHPKAPREKAIGRAGSADLAKRVKEAAFKTIDLKAEYGRIMTGKGMRPKALGGNLTTWLREVPPRSYLFISARVIGKTDFEATVEVARHAAQVLDGVGLFCFGPVESAHPTAYGSVSVPADISIDRVLYRACQDLRDLRPAAEGVDAAE